MDDAAPTPPPTAAPDAPSPPGRGTAWIRWALLLLGAGAIGALAWNWSPEGPDPTTRTDPAAGGSSTPAGGQLGPKPAVRPRPAVVKIVPALEDRFVTEPCNRIPGGGLFSVRAILDEAAETMPPAVNVFMGDMSLAPSLIGLVTTEYHYREVLPDTGINVVCAGEGELGHGTEFVRSILSRLPAGVVLCANAQDPDGHAILKGWSLHETGNRNILIVSVAAESVGYELVRRGSDVRIGSPIEAVAKAVQDADARALDLGRETHSRVLLVHGTLDEAEAIVRASPAFDFAVAADGPVLPALEPRDVDGTPIYYGGRGARFVWQRILDESEKGRVASLARVGGRIRAKGSPYNSRLAGLRGVIRRDILAAIQASDERPVDPRGEYVGSRICADCHPDEFTAHATSGHSRPPESFIESDFAGSTGCIGCHVTAPYHRGGWLPDQDLGLDAIGCESCHGPAAAHVASPQPGYGHVELVRCYDCHLPDRTPGFDAEALWDAAGHGALPVPPPAPVPPTDED